MNEKAAIAPDLPVTESANPRFAHMEELDIQTLMYRINEEDATVAGAVRKTIPTLARVAERAAEGIRQGGRLIYVGAGTSGRLGVLDASECPPTFGVPYDMVQGHMAGGERALTRAAEGAEDDAMAGAALIEKLNVGPNDTVLGISASGGAAFVIAAVKAAGERGAYTAALVSNENTPLSRAAMETIAPITGAEALAGSTRMKCGTAQKMALNMLSTCVMIRLGKARGGLMTDMAATNEKLRRRALHIVMQTTGADHGAAQKALEDNGMDTGRAIAALKKYHE